MAMMPVVSAPSNAPLTTGSGQTHQAWQNFFDQLATALQGAGWQIGDYRQTALSATTLGAAWLPCDGTSRNTADYPALAAILLPEIGPGQGDNTFMLPDIPSQSGAAQATAAALTTYIRAM